MAILHQFDGDRGERDALARERATGNSSATQRTIIMTNMTDESPMPFGKYKGLRMRQVPADYLLWIWDNGPQLHKQKDGLADYIRQNFTAISQEAPDVIVKNPPDVPRS